MPNILDKIILAKQQELIKSKVQVPLEKLEECITGKPVPLNFSGALTGTKVGTRWVLTIDDYGPDGKVKEAEPNPVDQQSEIKWLREQLETRTREVAELHQLLAAHSLNPGPPAPEPEPPPYPAPSTPWWVFWR